MYPCHYLLKGLLEPLFLTRISIWIIKKKKKTDDWEMQHPFGYSHHWGWYSILIQSMKILSLNYHGLRIPKVILEFSLFISWRKSPSFVSMWKLDLFIKKIKKKIWQPVMMLPKTTWLQPLIQLNHVYICYENVPLHKSFGFMLLIRIHSGRSCMFSFLEDKWIDLWSLLLTLWSSWRSMQSRLASIL